MPTPSDHSQDEDLRRLLEETRRSHERMLARSKRMGEEIRASTRRLREAIARFDARNAKG